MFHVKRFHAIMITYIQDSIIDIDVMDMIIPLC